MEGSRDDSVPALAQDVADKLNITSIWISVSNTNNKLHATSHMEQATMPPESYFAAEDHAAPFAQAVSSFIAKQVRAHSLHIPER